MSEIDTTNKHLVGVQGESIVIMNPPRWPMSKDDALTFAAWIVTLADDHEAFSDHLAAVQS